MIKFVATVSFLFSMVAFAGSQEEQGVVVDLDELVEICERMEANPQVKQFSSEVVCRGHQTYWEELEAGVIPMSTEFVIQSDVMMKGDRYRVGEDIAQMDSEDAQAQCNSYQEMQVSFSPVSVQLNFCAELRAMAEVGRDAFCQEHLTQKGAVPGTVTATGREFNSCNFN